MIACRICPLVFNHCTITHCDYTQVIRIYSILYFCMCTYIYIYIHICMYIHMYICMSIYIPMYACIYIFFYIHVCTRTYIYIHIYIYIIPMYMCRTRPEVFPSNAPCTALCWPRNMWIDSLVSLCRKFVETVYLSVLALYWGSLQPSPIPHCWFNKSKKHSHTLLFLPHADTLAGLQSTWLESWWRLFHLFMLGNAKQIIDIRSLNFF